MMKKSKAITQEDVTLFRQTVGSLQPLKKGAHTHIPQRSVKHPKLIGNTQWPQDELIENAALSDFVEVQYTPEQMVSFQTTELAKKTGQQLRQGTVTLDNTLDLHGQTIEQARSSLTQFIYHCHTQNHRCLLVIHGKGHRSSQGKAILKNKTIAWLKQMRPVLAFCSAHYKDGGAGALYVILRKYNRPSK